MTISSQAQAIKERKMNVLELHARNIAVTASAIVARRTGFLENAIGVGQVEIRNGLASIDIGTLLYPVPYAGFVERGTQGREKTYHRDGSAVYAGLGQHFMQRAWEAEKEAFLADIRK